MGQELAQYTVVYIRTHSADLVINATPMNADSCPKRAGAKHHMCYGLRLWERWGPGIRVSG